MLPELVKLPLIINQFNLLCSNDKIRIAHISLGMMGEAHLKWFAEFANVETVALCDVDQLTLKENGVLLQTLNLIQVFNIQ